MTRISHWPVRALAACMLAAVTLSGCGLFDDDEDDPPEIAFAAHAEGYAGNALVVANPYLAYAELSHLFDRKPRALPGVHPTAVVAADAQVDASASIGAYAVIESGAQIAAGVTVCAQCVIGARSVIGEGGWLAPRVTLYHDVRIGKRVVIQSGAVIGGEGFGFANEKGVWQKIAQIGGVSIGGGVGTVLGAALGVLFIGVVNGALPVIQVSPFWQQAIAGAVVATTR